jgi:hypothetical protein
VVLAGEQSALKNLIRSCRNSLLFSKRQKIFPGIPFEQAVGRLVYNQPWEIVPVGNPQQISGLFC